MSTEQTWSDTLPTQDNHLYVLRIELNDDITGDGIKEKLLAAFPAEQGTATVQFRKRSRREGNFFLEMDILPTPGAELSAHELAESLLPEADVTFAGLTELVLPEIPTKEGAQFTAKFWRSPEMNPGGMLSLGKWVVRGDEVEHHRRDGVYAFPRTYLETSRLQIL